MKLLFLIIASNNREHLQDEQTQRITWAQDQSIRVIWLRGGKSTNFEEEERTLYVEIEDVYPNILAKTLLGVEWCLKNLEFDFLVRANVSSYFDIPATRKMLHKYRASEDLFGGHMDFIQDATRKSLQNLFVNGGALFFSRITATRLLTMKSKDWELLPDDLAITQYLLRSGVTPLEFPRGNVANTGILTKKPYYRMKSSSNPRMATLRMTQVHAIRNSISRTDKFRLYLKFYQCELRQYRYNFSNPLGYLLSVYSLLSSKVRIIMTKATRRET